MSTTKSQWHGHTFDFVVTQKTYFTKQRSKVKIFYAYESLFNISFVRLSNNRMCDRTFTLTCFRAPYENLNLPLNHPVLENDKN